MAKRGIKDVDYLLFGRLIIPSVETSSCSQEEQVCFVKEHEGSSATESPKRSRSLDNNSQARQTTIIITHD